jgi:serine/threonine-protein kinase
MSPGVPAAVGRYQIRGEIGRGAMGAVYRAYDPKLGREVAVKLISTVVASGDDHAEIAARFEREARVAAQLHHPHVVSVYDAGSDGDTLYLVMELVDGDTLSHRLSRGDFPSTAEALEIVAQAADALAAAHEAGIIHRDIKPGNLLLSRSRVKVSDFGVAKAIGEKTDLTRTGMMVGSPAYMAPEQIKGMPLDGRSDLFSLGVVLFEMVFRRKPFPADTVTTLVYQILHEDPLQDPALGRGPSRELADFLRWTLAKDRESRIPDARTFAARARALAAQPSAAAAAAAETAPTALLATPARSATAERTAPAAAAVATAPAPAAAPGRGRGGSGIWIGLAAALALALAAVLWLQRKPSAPAVGLASAPAAPTAALPLAQPEAPPEPVVAAPVVEPEPEPEEPAPAPAPVVAARPAPPPPSTTGTIADSTVPVVATLPSPAPAPVSPAPEPAPPEPVWAGVFTTRRAAEFHVSPEEARVRIDGRAIGIADDWDGAGGGKAYVFPGPGEYRVELSLEGHHTAWVKVVVRADAAETEVEVDTELTEIE